MTMLGENCQGVLRNGQGARWLSDGGLFLSIRSILKHARDCWLAILRYNMSSVGAWPSGKATDFESVYRTFESCRPSLCGPGVCPGRSVYLAR